MGKEITVNGNLGYGPVGELFAALLTLVIVLAGLLLMIGGKQLARTFVRLMGRLFFVFLLVAMILPWLQNSLVNASSPLKVLLLSLTGVGLLMALIVAISPKFAGQVFTHIVSSFIYDVLKGTIKLVFGGFLRLVKLFSQIILL